MRHLLVVCVVCLGGCSQSVEGTVAQICGPNGWLPIGVRKGDQITDDTAKEIIGNNEARHAWCALSPKKA